MLFRCLSTTRLDRPVAPTIRTSLGTLTIEAKFGSETLVGESAVAVSSLTRGGYLWEWQPASAHAELLICRPMFTLPTHMAVGDCWSALYRVEVTQEVSGVAFSCGWEPG